MNKPYEYYVSTVDFGVPEQVTINSDLGIAEIVAHDEVTIEQMVTSRIQLIDAAKEHPLRGLLYDGRYITQAPDEDDLYSFAKRTFKCKQFKGIQLALLTSGESNLPYVYLTVTANRLGHYVRVFTDQQAALEWLGDGHKKEADNP